MKFGINSDAGWGDWLLAFIFLTARGKYNGWSQQQKMMVSFGVTIPLLCLISGLWITVYILQPDELNPG